MARRQEARAAPDEWWTIPVHKSLTRPQLFMGGERELVGMTYITVAAMCFALQSVTAWVLGFIAAVLVTGLLQRLAKFDPQLSLVYRRHLRFRSLYLARTRHTAPTLMVHRIKKD